MSSVDNVEHVAKKARVLEEDDHKENNSVSSSRRVLEQQYLQRTFTDDGVERSCARVEYDDDEAEWRVVTTSAGGEKTFVVGPNSRIDALLKAPEDVVKVGDTIEVLWEVADLESLEDKRVLLWWKCLVAAKGEKRVVDEDGVEDLLTWTLRYEPKPEVSEPDEAEAEVSFLSKRALLDLDADMVMQWRREGSNDAVENDLTAELLEAAGEEASEETSLEAQVDVAVGRALEGMKTAFDKLPRDRQCAVADKVVQAKVTLTAALTTHLEQKDNNEITADDVAAVIQSLKSHPDMAMASSAPAH